MAEKEKEKIKEVEKVDTEEKRFKILAEKALKVIESKEYKMVAADIENFQKRIEAAEGKELDDIRNEIRSYFEALKSRNKELAIEFKTSNNALLAAIYKKLTGEDILID